MARPREFDEGEALDGALETFWEQGYEATSLPALLDSTGLSRGSLYKAFGSKHELYLRTLDRYLGAARQGLARTLNEEPSVRRGIQRWLEMVAESATGQEPRCGCFAVNSAVELGPHDDEVRAMLDAHNRALEEIVVSVLRRGLASKEIPSRVTPEAVARTLRLMISGLQVGGKATLSREDAMQSVQTVMRLLD